MFNNLANRISGTIDGLRGKKLTESNMSDALREIRIALLEADVALPVVKDFIAKVKERAEGEQVIKSVSPGQMVVKIVYDELALLLGGKQGDEAEQIEEEKDSHDILPLFAPPNVILMCGLQGSGKTTSTAKLGKWLSEKQNKKVLTASLDIYRPAAQEQLEIVSGQAGISSLPIVTGEKPEKITKRAISEAKKGGYDVLLLDTAGRLHIDDELMQELKDVCKIAQPIHSLLVVDALTGQDAVNVANEFSNQIELSGVIMTRMDSDSRGGAALSLRHVTGCPLLFMGVGEKIDAFEPFHPERIANRILGMGDVVSLVEKAAESFEEEKAKDMAKRFEQGEFDMDDLLGQLRQMKKMGGLQSVMGFLPSMMGGMNLQEKMEQAGVDEKMLTHQEAIILSMTKKERKDPKIINGSRKKRIAAGSGTDVPLVNRVLKQHKQMHQMMKRLRKMGGKKGGMKAALGQMMEMMGGQEQMGNFAGDMSQLADMGANMDMNQGKKKGGGKAGMQDDIGDLDLGPTPDFSKFFGKK